MFHKITVLSRDLSGERDYKITKGVKEGGDGRERREGVREEKNLRKTKLQKRLLTQWLGRVVRDDRHSCTLEQCVGPVPSPSPRTLTLETRT